MHPVVFLKLVASSTRRALLKWKVTLLHSPTFQTTAQTTLKVSINQRISPFFPKNETSVATSIVIHPMTITAQT